MGAGLDVRTAAALDIDGTNSAAFDLDDVAFGDEAEALEPSSRERTVKGGVSASSSSASGIGLGATSVRAWRIRPSTVSAVSAHSCWTHMR